MAQAETMAYKKFLVDNTTCSRRYHITFDDQAEPLPRVELRCQFCSAVVFTADNHPPVRLAREENLVKTSALSENLTTTCNFEDSLSKRTIAAYKDKDAHVYPAHATGRKV
jgi:hypothetical protein